MEQLPNSPAGGAIEGVISLAGPALAVGSSLVVTTSSEAAGVSVAASVVAGLGIVDWFRKLGTAKVKENLESLGQATEDALNRVERVLLEHGTSIDEIKSRLNSQDFKDGMASASLHALRTTQEDRLKRMARILANGVRENDLAPESLDDLMKAAVELSDADVGVLKFISSKQVELVTPGYKDAIYGWPDAWLREVQKRWQAALTERGSAFTQGKFNAGQWRSSLARLHGLGFIGPVQHNPTTNSPGEEPYGLLPMGQGFLDRLREIAAQ
jgi:hypothetical protein